MKYVINNDFGGFSLSEAAMLRYAELKGFTLYEKRDEYGRVSFYTDLYRKEYFSDDSIKRSDPALVQAVEELGDKADGDCAHLVVIDIPKGERFVLREYDGNEHVELEKEIKWEVAT